jgi:hypothetical protein
VVRLREGSGEEEWNGFTAPTSSCDISSTCTKAKGVLRWGGTPRGGEYLMEVMKLKQKVEKMSKEGRTGRKGVANLRKHNRYRGGG